MDCFTYLGVKLNKGAKASFEIQLYKGKEKTEGQRWILEDATHVNNCVS